MEPRKKDVADYAIPIIGVLIALFLALHMAVSYENVKDSPLVHDYTDENGNLVENRNFDYVAFFTDLSDRLTTEPDNIQWVASTPKFLLLASFVCLLVIGYVVTSKRKYINNKEYGTSEWAKPKDLAHLWAKNLLKQEIKNIKKSKEKHKAKKIADAKIQYSDNSDILLTQTERICMYNFELNNNTLIIGGSGSGKTRGYVLPNILQCCNSKFSPSFVVTDPKGEIIGKIGKYLEMCGYVIKVLNLKEQNRSFCFNPFKYIREDKYEEQISTLVSSIMDSRTENSNQKSNDPFWEDMAKILLNSLHYAVYEGFPEEEQNMPTVMEMFRWFEVTDNDDREKNPTKLDTFFEVFGDIYGTYKVADAIIDFYKTYYSECFEDVQIESQLPLQKKLLREHISIPFTTSSSRGIEQYRTEIELITNSIISVGLLSENIDSKSKNALYEIDQYIENRITDYANDEKPIGVCLYEKYGDMNTNPALRSWEDFRSKCKGKTAQSVISTALAKIAPFDEAQIRRIFTKDEMELDLIGERRTALFIVLPPTKKTYNFIANVLYVQLFDELEYCATVKHDQQLPVPVRFILDEFYNTGRIPNFENILSYARSFGISISIILQSLDQIKEMYEKSWGTVLDNCATFLYLGRIRHIDTLKYISDLLGKGTFDKKTVSVTKGRQSSTSTSNDKIGRELLDPAEIQRLNKRKCLLFVSGYQPYMSLKYNYKRHKNYKYTSDYSKKNLYYYEVPKNDKVNNPHGEEVVYVEKVENSYIPRPKTPPIILNTNEEEVLKILNDNIINLDLESGEEVALSTNEVEELNLLQDIIEDEKQETEKITSFVKSVVTDPIIIKLDSESIDEATETLYDNINDVDIVNPTDMDEIITYDSEDDEEWEDDTVADMDNIEMTLGNLVEDMVNDGFITDLDDIKIEELEEGEINEIEESETA